LNRRLVAAAAALAVNVPWLLVWRQAEREPLRLFVHVPALFMLLALGVSGAVALPCVLLPGLTARRWLLIILLALANLFWPLRWIDLHAGGGSGYPGAGAGLPVFLGLMLLSSTAAVAVYAAAGAALGFVRRRGR
jgi:hypothetical protein